MPLSEPRRAQLDSIVKLMIANKESDANIQAVVNDFSSKYTNENVTPSAPTKPNIVTRTAQAVKGAFVDPVARELIRPGVSLVRGVQGLTPGGKQGTESLQTPFGEVKPYTELSSREALAGAAELGASVVGAGGAGAIGKQAAKGAVKAGIKTGAIVGATAGGLTSFGDAVRQGNGVKKVVLDTAKGAATGAALGAAIPAVAGTTRNLISKSATRLAETKVGKANQAVLDLVSPVLNKAQKEAAIAEGRGTSSKLLRPGTILPSNQDKNIATAVTGVVDPKKGLIDNVGRVRKAIQSEAQTLVSSLKKNDGIFNEKQLGAHLRSIEKPLELISEQGQEKAYREAQTKFMSFVNKNEKNLSGLLKARKEFDAWLEESIPNLYEKPNLSGLRQALVKMRGAANDYIESRLPTGHPFRASLRRQSLMYRAIDNMAEKAAKQEIGSSKLGRVVQKLKEHPIATVGGASGGTAIAAYQLGKRALNR